MTGRRFALQPSKTPTLTGGDDRPADKCPLPLDVIDAVYARGHAGARARERAYVHCSHCPLRDTCWADPEWRKALNETPPGDAA